MHAHAGQPTDLPVQYEPLQYAPQRAGRLLSAGLAIVLICLTGFAIWAAVATNQAASLAKRSNELSDRYQQARYAIGAEESLERKYRLEPSPEVRGKHRAAADDLIAALQSVRQQGDASDRALADEVLASHGRYLDALERMFAAVDAGDTARVNAIDGAEVDPVFDQIETQVDTAADRHHTEALQRLTDLDRTEGFVFTATPIVFTLGLTLLGLCWGVLRAYQRRLDEAGKRAAEQEVERLRSAAEKEAAEAANRAKSTLLSYMSHEMRTPLSAIIGYAESLQERAEMRGYADLVPGLGKVHVTGWQMLGLINNLLDLSKIEAGKMELCVERFAVGPLIEEAATTLHPLVEQKGNTLDIHYDHDLGTMCSDLTKVRQVLFNLLSNAIKFTQHGTIALNAAREAIEGEEWITFRVVDNGIGMTAEQLQHLFEEFTQANNSTTRNYGGTGLGLAISRRFCQLMGGDISVESQVGEGSTFTVRLPAAIADTAAEQALAQEELSSILQAPGEQVTVPIS